jgi:hypothetical protein
MRRLIATLFGGSSFTGRPAQDLSWLTPSLSINKIS